MRMTILEQGSGPSYAGFAVWFNESIVVALRAGTLVSSNRPCDLRQGTNDQKIYNLDGVPQEEVTGTSSSV
jgi:hypothetical protein